MKRKLIQPTQHAINDYVLTGVQAIAPTAIGMNTAASNIYKGLGTGFLAVNALTKTKAGIYPLLSLKTHKKADLGFLAALSVLTFVDPIRRHRKSLIFHLSFLAISAAHYALTNYKGKS